jgi:hypothetical protein
MAIYALTVATHNDGYYNALTESCKRNNINLITLGFGLKWQGFSWRFLLVKEYIETLNDDDIVIFLDAYDVFAINNIDVIEERFKSFNSPIVLSTEKYIMNHTKIGYQALFRYCDKAYVNSGLYMGYVHGIKKLYKNICEKYNCKDSAFSNLDDQKILIQVCKDDDFVKENIKFDYDSIIFYNITYGEPPFFKDNMDEHQCIIRNNQINNKKYNYSPCFIHGPGNINMDKIILLYDLKGCKPCKRSNFKYVVKTTAFKIFTNFILIIILTIIFYKYLENNIKN